MFKNYFTVKKNGLTPFETMTAYLGGSAFQTIIDNPVTSYRQLVQQYAKDLNGNVVDPKISRLEVNKVFKKSPKFPIFHNRKFITSFEVIIVSSSCYKIVIKYIIVKQHKKI